MRGCPEGQPSTLKEKWRVVLQRDRAEARVTRLPGRTALHAEREWRVVLCGFMGDAYTSNLQILLGSQARVGVMSWEPFACE